MTKFSGFFLLAMLVLPGCGDASAQVIRPSATPRIVTASARPLAEARIPAGVSYDPLPESPEVYYQLDETSGTSAADSSGNSHDGSYTAAFTLGQTPPFGVGTAVLFGANGKVAPTVNYAPTGLTAYSMECWFKTTSTTIRMPMMSHYNGSTGGFTLHMNAGGAGGQAGAVQFGWTADGNEHSVYTNAATFGDGGWHHAVGVWEHSGGGAVLQADMKIYVDGALQATSLSTFGGTVPHPNTMIYWQLARTNSWAQSFIGTLDECAVYEAALSAEQVANHFADSGL